MKVTIQTFQYEKHLMRKDRCPICFSRYINFINYRDTNTWTVECKGCGLSLYDEYSTRKKAYNEWKYCVENLDRSKIELALKH